MLESLLELVECPVCLETLTAPIKQCGTGHSFCHECADKIGSCPLCKLALTSTRNYPLEKVTKKLQEIDLSNRLTSFQHFCRSWELKYANSHLQNPKMGSGEATFDCEGKTFAGWSCDWKGDCATMIEHFKLSHTTKIQGHPRFQAQFDTSPLQFFDMRLVEYGGGKYFWYKHKIDLAKENAYWLVQYGGGPEWATHYFYELSLVHHSGRKVKIREICESNLKYDNDLMMEGKCIALPFSVLKKFPMQGLGIMFNLKIGAVENSPDENQMVKTSEINKNSGNSNQFNSANNSSRHLGQTALIYTNPNASPQRAVSACSQNTYTLSPVAAIPPQHGQRRGAALPSSPGPVFAVAPWPCVTYGQPFYTPQTYPTPILMPPFVIPQFPHMPGPNYPSLNLRPH